VLRLDEPSPVFKGFLVGWARLIVQHSSLSLDRLFWAESSLRSFSFNEDDSAQNNQRRSKLMMPGVKRGVDCPDNARIKDLYRRASNNYMSRPLRSSNFIPDNSSLSYDSLYLLRFSRIKGRENPLGNK